MLPVAHDFTTLREALRLADDPALRAKIALELALALCGVMRNRDARVVIEEALRDANRLDPELVLALEQVLIGGGMDDLAEAPRLVSVIDRHLAAFRRGTLTDPRGISALTVAGLMIGGVADETAALARRALADERLLYRWIDDGWVTAAYALSTADQVADARVAIERGLTEAQRSGSTPMLLQLNLMRCELAWRCGDLDTAEDYSERALARGEELGAAEIAILWNPSIQVERGRCDRAWELISDVPIDAGSNNGCVLLCERGRVQVARGELAAGLADLLRADEAMRGGRHDLSVQADWIAPAAHALAVMGRDQQARELADRELTDARRFGAPRRLGMALSVRGSLDPGPSGLELLREAVSVLERSPARLEHAHALVRLGTALRIRGERMAARQPLARALDLAGRCGSAALSETARAELVSAGARPRRASLRGPDSLTPAELRVARMAAQGLANRQIAQTLFVSTKTVETQLSQAYAKLRVAGRAGLAGALSGAGSSSPRT
jgi:DNA-binding NarL/FixJ family response regulator